MHAWTICIWVVCIWDSACPYCNRNVTLQPGASRTADRRRGKNERGEAGS
jgi:hypothetical protein